jgi:CheY-like chemotaxis protein
LPPNLGRRHRPGLIRRHGILKTHGGAITAYSEPGKGTAFHAYLPVVRGAAEPAAMPKPVDEARGHGERILYIDDEEPLVFLMTRMLSQLGYIVTGCIAPERALELFTAAPGDFDAVVSDLSMPGMSGIDLAREFLRIKPGMPILIASGYIRPEDNEEVRRLGLPDVLLKPDTIEKLGQSLHSVFAVSTPSAPGGQTDNSNVRGKAASRS